MELTARKKCFLETIEMIWTEHPDWTFSELIENTVGRDFVSLDDENAYDRILVSLVSSYPSEDNEKADCKKFKKERDDFLKREDYEGAQAKEKFMSALQKCYPDCAE